MKIIEAMKRVKANKEKIQELQTRISQVSANLSYETPVYGTDTPAKIKEWAQSCEDTTQENIRLLTNIARTNLQTKATITLGGVAVTKTLAEWIWRRREYAAIDHKTWQVMTDRGLKDGKGASSTGIEVEVKVVRHYDIKLRDEKITMYRTEAHEIDAALEVVNAVTDLVE